MEINGEQWELEIKSIEIRPLTDEEIKERRNTWEDEQRKWYSVLPIKKEVTKAEFDAFIKAYPRKLDCDCCGISDPPAISYNDLELANRWPFSVVASTFGYTDDPKDYWYAPPEERFYSIMVNYEEVFNSRTGYKE